MKLSPIQKALRQLADPKKIPVYRRFFKTGPGEYGEGDIFIGVTVPNTRMVAKQFKEVPLNELVDLIESKVHEDRLLALLILTLKYPKADEAEKSLIFKFYLDNKAGINNWDLVDTSAPQILGAHLIKRDRAILYKLAKSKRMWDRRLAILSTLAFIRNYDFSDTLKLAEMFLSEKEDLMHKATGWMLREMGHKDEKKLEKFLLKNFKKMPRTMLRYSIERLSAGRKKFYMKK